jgi:hypothetical protein
MVSVQFHVVLLSVVFITQQCQLLQWYVLVHPDKLSTNTTVTSDSYHLSTIILFSDTRSVVSPYVSFQSEDRVFSFVRYNTCVFDSE